jgi:hypothetical protein
METDADENYNIFTPETFTKEFILIIVERYKYSLLTREKEIIDKIICEDK